MERELSEEEIEKRERLAEERERKRLARQAEKERVEREELAKLNAQLRSAKKARRKAAADSVVNSGRRSLIAAANMMRTKSAAAAESSASALKKLLRRCGALCFRCASFCDRCADCLSRFALKKYSLPAIILFSFFALWLTAFVGGHNMFALKTQMQNTFYELYLCDFSAGFCSRVLVGAVVGLFLDKISISQMTQIANGAVVVSFVLLALITGIVLRKGLREKAFAPVALAVLLLFEPVVVQSNYLFLGTLDVYVLICYLLILCSYRTPAFYIVAPALSALALIIHYHYVFSFFPAVAALFLYDLFLGKDRRSRTLGGVGFGVTSAVTVPFFFYLVFFAQNHLKCTADEFYEHMVSRFDVSPGVRATLQKLFDGDVILRNYFDYYIFGYHDGGYHFDNPFHYVYYLFQHRVGKTAGSIYLKFSAYTVPVLIVFIALWWLCAKSQKGIRRLPYILFACLPLALVPEIYISTDVPRWASTTLTCQFTLLFAVYMRGDEGVRKLFCGSDRRTSLRRLFWIACAAVYIAVMMAIGRHMPIFI